MMKIVSSGSRSHDNIIVKIKDQLKDFVAQAKHWTIIPRATIRPDDQEIVWMPLTSSQTSSFALTAIMLYLNGLKSFNIIDDFLQMEVSREQYVGDDSYRGLRIKIDIVLGITTHNINDFFEF
jgi:phenylalanine-4-hydroxylase